MPESGHNNDPCANSWADDGTPESPHDDEPGAADDTHESARHDESCAQSRRSNISPAEDTLRLESLALPGIAVVPGSVQQLRREETYKSF